MLDSERSLIRTVHGGGCHPGIAFILDRTAVTGSADRLRTFRSPLVLRLEAVKDASDRVGGHLGRRELGYPFVLVHCLPGAREQLVDAYGTP